MLTNLGVGGGVASDAALQANGDIVVSGGFGLARYLPNGQLDRAFGASGVASTGFAFDGDSGTAVAVQPDGKIIWVGSQGNPAFTPGGTFEFAVARFNPNGTLDASFGSGGRVGTEFFAPPLQGAQEFADAVLVQPDGKILVAGSARQGQNRFAPIQGAIARFNSNGSLDSGFRFRREGPVRQPRHGHRIGPGCGGRHLRAPRAGRIQPVRPGRCHGDPRRHHRELAWRGGRVPA